MICGAGKLCIVDRHPIQVLNTFDRGRFVAVCGPLFEHSPWIAERAWSARPFASADALHSSLCDVMYGATVEEQIDLISSHPDLVGRLAKQGRLTAESTAEQAAAGLGDLSADDADAFDRYNSAYRERFGFPFVICARKNEKAAILAAFPVRLGNSREQEIRTALAEIAKIAKLRLMDAVSDG
jgi:2-oxo-4-hydroxy-4-carboxy-5-ureidoimidazoline decarboxylase